MEAPGLSLWRMHTVNNEQHGQGFQGNGGLASSEGSLYAAAVSLWRPLVLFFVALTLIRAWEEIFFIGSVLPFPATEHDNNWVYFMSKSITFFAGALVGPKLFERFAGRLLGTMALAGGLCAAACKLAMLFAPDWAPLLVVVAAISGGVGVSLTMLLWFVLCARVNATMAILCYLSVRVLSPVIIVFLCSLPVPWPGIVGLALLPGAVAAIVRGTALLPEAPDRRRGLQVPSCWMVVALLSIFDFAFALREPLLGNAFFSSGSYTAFGSILIALLMLLSVVLGRGWFNVGTVVRVVLPLASVAFLLLPTNLVFPRIISDVCSAASGTGVEALAILIIANQCYRYGLSPLRRFGVLFGCEFLVVCAGRYAWPLLASLGIGEAGIMACFDVVAVVAVALMVVLLPDRKMFEDWGFDLSGTACTLSDADEVIAAQGRAACHAFAQAKGLTAREEEVLLLIVANKTNGEIQNSLSVSKETVRTHRRNLYGKCDVHSRDELIEALGIEGA